MCSITPFEMLSFKDVPSEPLAEIPYSTQSFEIFENPKEVPSPNMCSDVTDLSIPDGVTVSMILQHLKKIIHENAILKGKLKHGNHVMTDHLNSIAGWQSQIAETHDKYRNILKNFMTQNEKLQMAKLELEKKVEHLQEMTGRPQDSDDDTASWASVEDDPSIIGMDCVGSPCKEDLLLQNQQLQNQVHDVSHKLIAEKIDIENHKKLLEKELKIRDLQEALELLTHQYSESLSIITELENNQRKLTCTIHDLKAQVIEITEKRSEENLKFEKLLKEKENDLQTSQKAHKELTKQNAEKISEMTITLDGSQKKLEVADQSLAKFENLVKEKENELQASQGAYVEMTKQTAGKMSGTLAMLDSTKEKLVKAELSLVEFKKLLKEKGNELEVSQRVCKELTNQNKEKHTALDDTQKKLVEAEQASKTFSEVFTTLEHQAMKYKKELDDMQLYNHENECTIAELKMQISVHVEEAKRKEAECKLHKKSQEETDLTLKKLSEEQQKWSDVLHNSVQNHEDLQYQIDAAWGRMCNSVGSEREEAWQNLVTIHQDQLETVSVKLFDTQKVLEAEQDNISILSRRVEELENERLAQNGGGAIGTVNAEVIRPFSCPFCSSCYDDLQALQCHVEECLNQIV